MANATAIIEVISSRDPSRKALHTEVFTGDVGDYTDNLAKLAKLKMLYRPRFKSMVLDPKNPLHKFKETELQITGRLKEK